ncbi:hypothetical protein L1S35_04715 [Flavobacterium sp. AS60]|uniref:hypothetical protein n=1 Tax=Flavobacterium anseongense TaxID=2910677 RepID=UPI001F33ABC6|nr:hypothetical protein [Flavobacterium sp. AS60]MCF6128964.1 hypothetical protein [Flavobacterium sp. AS60]
MKPITKSKAKFKSVVMLLLVCPVLAFSQSDTVNLIRGGELLFGGLITIFKSSKPKNVNSTVVESVCIKNKLEGKITFIITRQTEDGDEIRKELVIQKGGKEYFYELPKGVYTYEVVLTNNSTFKKGEYRFDDKSTMIVDGDIVKNPDE